ncbi:hypothetical protein AAG570_002805 [Ranatra chinensis]|uniref:HTH HARE-type domain-containing protein n=1 Tax=Ranatra chinensis TaxID=642074 RepID=A0ABD0YTE6_9HEMI
MEPRVTEVGPNEMILNVLDAVYSLQSCRGEREAEGWGAEEVRAKLAEMGLGAGGGGLEAALEGALEAALEGGYLREGPRGGYALAQPIDKFVALLKTSFGASPRRKPRPKTRRKDAQISKGNLIGFVRRQIIILETR